MSEKKQHLLEVKDLAVSFDTYAGEVQAVRGVSFTLDEGETLAVVGESGSGKSVSMKMVMQLLDMPPARLKSGSVLYKGEEMTKKTDKEMEKYRGKEFSMIFQDSMTGLNPTMRVGRQLAEGIMKHQNVGKAEAKKIAIEMLTQVGLPNPETIYKRYPHTLSGGQRQRVMIAMAISCHPAILFADEPTTALDVTMQAQILKLMKELQKKTGTAIVLVTHDLGVVASMADRVSVMYAGRIVEAGTARQIFFNPCHPYTWGLLGAMPNMLQDVKEELYSIPGTPPDMFAPPKGCAFAARCEYCMEACLKAEPDYYTCSDGHLSKCWLMDKRAGEVRPPEGVNTVPRKEAEA